MLFFFYANNGHQKLISSVAIKNNNKMNQINDKEGLPSH